MKTKHFFSAMMMAAVAFTSCSNDASVLEDPIVEQNQSQSFTFRMTGADLSVSMTRASLTANGTALTDLYVLDYDKQTGTLLQVLHQQSTDPKFAEPELTLAYGQHTIRFIASRSTGSKLTTSDGTEFTTTPGTVQTISATIPALYTAQKISDTFTASVDVTAGSGSQNNVQVQLVRAASRLQLVMTDAIPQDAKTMTMTISTAYTAFALSGMTAQTGIRTTDIDLTSVRGKTNQKITVFTLAPEQAWTTTITLTCKREDGTTLASHTLDDVSMLRNRSTVISGTFFSQQGYLSPTFNVSDTWQQDNNVSL